MTCLDDFIMEPVEKMHLFMSIRDPTPIVTGAVEMTKRGWLWRATPEQAKEVRRNDYVAVFEGVGCSDTDDVAKVLRRGYFTILRDDWKPKNESMFGPIPDEILKAV